MRFRRRDYLGDPRVPLDEAVRDGGRSELTGTRPEGPIRRPDAPALLRALLQPGQLLLLLRRRRASGCRRSVAEVTNTPWGERHAYVIDRSARRRRDSRRFGKALHVSPFMGMDQRYTLARGGAGRDLSVHIESSEDGERAFDATLALRRARADARARWPRVTARYPAATLRMLALIYGHAVALKLKGVPVQPAPGSAAA